MMVAAELLTPVGETRARRYTATEELRAVRNRVAAGRPSIIGPFGGRGEPDGTTRNLTTQS